MISIECVKCQVRKTKIFKKFKTSILVMNCVNPQISGLLFGMTFVDAALSRVQPLPWLRSPMKPMSIGSDDHRAKVQSLEKQKKKKRWTAGHGHPHYPCHVQVNSTNHGTYKSKYFIKFMDFIYFWRIFSWRCSRISKFNWPTGIKFPLHFRTYIRDLLDAGTVRCQPLELLRSPSVPSSSRCDSFTSFSVSFDF